MELAPKGRSDRQQTASFVFPAPDERFRPYGFYDRMRRDSPVAYDAQNDLWGVYRYDDVRRVIFDFANFSSDFQKAVARVHPETAGYRLRSSLLGADPPRHRGLRDIVSRAFRRSAIANWEPRISRIADELLDNVVPSGRMDVVADLAYPLPVIVIAEMLGIPPADRAKFKRWSDDLAGGLDGLAQLRRRPEERVASRKEIDDYFRSYIDERRAKPRGDLISGLALAKIDGAALLEDDILSFCSLLLVAGNVTTTNLIGNAIFCLLQHPEQFQRLLADPGFLPSAIEEVLRYESPVQAIMRIAAHDVEIDGHLIRAGQRVAAIIGSANRDESVFAEAGEFNVGRDPNPHLAFGHGIHFCLGASLARLEGRIVIAKLLARTCDLRLVEHEPIATTKGLILHGITSLPLHFNAL